MIKARPQINAIGPISSGELTVTKAADCFIDVLLVVLDVVQRCVHVLDHNRQRVRLERLPNGGFKFAGRAHVFVDEMIAEQSEDCVNVLCDVTMATLAQ